MKLYYFRGSHRNFGDELNHWLWPRVFGDIFDADASQIFIGIGSTLLDSFPPSSTKIVFGAGYGGYTRPPDVGDRSWRIYFVRGPRTARILNLDGSAAITDAAVLVSKFCRRRLHPQYPVSFIPHWESISRGRWQQVCSLANVHFIDPRAPVETVLDEISDSATIVAEAMHGAIVADALRIPWIAVTPTSPANRTKWLDWSESLDMSYKPHAALTSSVRELWTVATGREARGHAQTIGISSMVTAAETPLVHWAARRMRAIAGAEPYLSSAATLSRALERIDEQIEAFKNDLARR